ncbi:tRNA 2-thiouridine(34) synthase MnmA [Candidatus Protochlamydia phocaeensis]|uniref:tRNA 2-thiouridine(34) synthase MnmA n=1 Tax=Candidatus Protochlamydia phocaeensis TaxID=1414722 RepID=UPI0008398FF3|nr:tRNA 2-thiouridine(34) synthase MnmA [Candidatus Protochlamydia phocaeensis]
MNQNKTVIVGMSGGVDSSVSALLLKQQGYRVIGLFMKNWEEKDENGVCRSAYDYEDVRRVCEQIDIPYYAVNFVEDYWNQVFTQFLADFKKGLTPNPDILCNREIKFKVFLDKAMELGADYLATGHYCQNVFHDGHPSLVKGMDANKDQTYFLYTLNRRILDKVLFPVGGLEKSEVRNLARQSRLATSEKKDSTGICFIGKRDFRTFLSQYIAMQPGCFETLQGKKVGQHLGTAYYTLGQRKGLGIGGPGEAWFVVGKDIERGIVFVEQGADHPALYCDELFATDLSWIAEQPPVLPFSCQAKVRYRQIDQPCTIQKIEAGKAWVTFANPQRAVTPGQSIVFYEGTHCLGGGVIQQAGPSYYQQGKPLPAE